MSGRHSNHKERSFDFLGYTFKPRIVKSKQGVRFLSFVPGVSKTAKKSMRRSMKSWKLHFRTNGSLEDIADSINPVLMGWFNYYGRFNKVSLSDVWKHLNWRLAKWLGRKYKRLQGKLTKCIYRLGKIARLKPQLFVHWKLNCKPPVG